MIKIETNQKDIILIQISDTHLLSQMGESFVGINPEQHFQQILNLIQQKCPDMTAIIHTGDIAQEAYPDVYERYIATMQGLNIPFFHTLGNHDNPNYFPNNEPDSPTIHPSVIHIGNWQIILLNTAVVGRIDGRISDTQLDDLRQILSQNTQPTILAFHHHAFAMQSTWLDEHLLKNTEQLLAVLQDFSQVKACFMGHVHQASHTKWQQIDFYSVPATSVQFKPQSHDFSLDDTAPAFRKIVLKADGEIETELFYLDEFQHVCIKHKGY